MFENKILRSSVIFFFGISLILGCEKNIIKDLEANGNNFETESEYYPLKVDTIYFSNTWPPRVIANVSLNEELFNSYQSLDWERIAVVRDGAIISTGQTTLEPLDVFPPLHTWFEYQYGILEDSVISKLTEPISVYTWD